MSLFCRTEMNNLIFYSDLLDSQQAKYTLERDIQQFQLDCDVVANWLTQKETLLILDEDLLNSLDVVKVAVENHNQLKRTFDNEKIRMLSLINFQPEVTLRDNSTDQILQKRNEVNFFPESSSQTLLMVKIKLILYFN